MQTDVNVTPTACCVCVRLRHERHSNTNSVSDLVQTLLEHSVLICCLQHIRVTDVELVLTDTGFAFACFYGDATVLEVLTAAAGVALFFGCLCEVIVSVVRADRGDEVLLVVVAVRLLVGVVVGVIL